MARKSRAKPDPEVPAQRTDTTEGSGNLLTQRLVNTPMEY